MPAFYRLRKACDEPLELLSSPAPGSNVSLVTPHTQGDVVEVPVLVEWRNASEAVAPPIPRLNMLVNFLAALHSAEADVELALSPSLSDPRPPVLSH